MLENKIVYIKNKFEKNDILQEKYTNSKKYPGLIKIHKLFKNYGGLSPFILDPPSEHEHSDEEERLKEPTVFKVVDSILDFNSMMILTNLDDFPKECEPSLLFMNLDEWITNTYLKKFIEEMPIFNECPPEIESISLLKFKKMLMGTIKFKKFSDIDKIYKFFNSEYKFHENPLLNSKSGKVEVFYYYDLKELTLSSYYAVVLRNLPDNSTHEGVKYYCKQRSDGISYVLNPIKIKSSFCTIVLYKDLDDAEKLCKCIKNETTKTSKIKAHIHPKSCKIRKNPDKSHFRKFLVKKEKIKFSENILQSEKSIEKSLSMVCAHKKYYESIINNHINDNLKKANEIEPINHNLEKSKDENKTNSGDSKSKIKIFQPNEKFKMLLGGTPATEPNANNPNPNHNAQETSTNESKNIFSLFNNISKAIETISKQNNTTAVVETEVTPPENVKEAANIPLKPDFSHLTQKEKEFYNYCFKDKIYYENEVNNDNIRKKNNIINKSKQTEQNNINDKPWTTNLEQQILNNNFQIKQTEMNLNTCNMVNPFFHNQNLQMMAINYMANPDKSVNKEAVYPLDIVNVNMTKEAIIPPKEENLPPLPEAGSINRQRERNRERDRRRSKSPQEEKYRNKKRNRSRSRSKSRSYSNRKNYYKLSNHNSIERDRNNKRSTYYRSRSKSPSRSRSRSRKYYNRGYVDKKIKDLSN